MSASGFERDVVIVGGCGRVGLPLGIAFAEAGLTVTLFDTNAEAVARVGRGEMPFLEPGCDERLPKLLGDHLVATTEASVVATGEYVVVVIGTPIDDHLNPNPSAVGTAIAALADHLVDGQAIVLRSTLFPGTTAFVERSLTDLGRTVDVLCCPERIAEGAALRELRELPQIVSSRTESGLARAERLFGALTDRTVRLTPEEAELAKLFTNTWRYIKFATANQLYTMANDFGLDYGQIRDAIREDYPRAADLPGAGFSAGPCLLKDTMQLAAFNNNNFVLGHAAMMVNEGLPLYVVSRLEATYPLAELCVGILGMSFKAGSDDPRSSLSYKLKRILRFRAREVLCHDPYVEGDPDLVALDEVLGRADLLVVGTPHPDYASLETKLPIVDVTGMCGTGVL